MSGAVPNCSITHSAFLARLDLLMILLIGDRAWRDRMLTTRGLQHRYHDYRAKGKYAADLLWDRDRRLRSESENQKTWEQIKRAAAAQHHSSTHWSVHCLHPARYTQILHPKP